MGEPQVFTSQKPLSTRIAFLLFSCIGVYAIAKSIGEKYPHLATTQVLLGVVAVAIVGNLIYWALSKKLSLTITNTQLIYKANGVDRVFSLSDNYNFQEVKYKLYGDGKGTDDFFFLVNGERVDCNALSFNMFRDFVDALYNALPTDKKLESSKKSMLEKTQSYTWAISFEPVPNSMGAKKLVKRVKLNQESISFDGEKYNFSDIEELKIVDTNFTLKNYKMPFTPIYITLKNNAGKELKLLSNRSDKATLNIYREISTALLTEHRDNNLKMLKLECFVR